MNNISGSISGLINNRPVLNAFFYLSIVSAAFTGAIASLSNGFVWDDIHVVTNPVLVDTNSFYGYFFGNGIYYRPFWRVSLSLDWSLWRMNPLGYHLNNLVVHAANSLLVFVMAERLMTRGDAKIIAEQAPADRIPAFLAALTFALHPVHSEPIAWISGRTDLLVTFFFLLGFLGFLVYRWEDDAKGIVICALFYLFSMFSKENGIMLIAVVLAYGLLTKMPWRRLMLSVSVLFAVVIVYFMMRHGSGLSEVIMKPGTAGAYLSPQVSFTGFLKTLVYGSGYYIEKLLLPMNLNLLPAIPEGAGYVWLFCAAVGGSVFCLVRCGSPAPFLLLWIVLTMLPSLSVMFSQVASPLGERYLYLSSVGFSIFLAWGCAKILNRRVFIGVFILISIWYFVLINERVGQWRSDLTLWGDTVKKSPASATAHTNYAIALMQEQDIVNSEKELFTALRIPNKSGEQTALILNALSNIEIMRKDYKKAIDYLTDAIKYDTGCSAAFNNLGYVYMQMSAADGVDEQGKTEALRTAISYFNKALEIVSYLSQTKFNLGLCYFELNDYDKAAEYFNATVEADPVSKLGQQAASLLAAAKMRKAAGGSLRR
uniref:TPR-repeat-containing protein n=1 Tax=uncultured Nitrospirae bacterium MY3-11A TaxID=798579 RepID=D9MP53_9BACT|nr:TPR-repeat-containing protein [uncultured Nitrospirae bacterium MY3-11A]